MKFLFFQYPLLFLNSNVTRGHTFNPFPNKPGFFTCLQNKSFENTEGKEEIACNEQFLLFPAFSTCLENFLPFSSTSELSFANSFSLEESKYVVWERFKILSSYSRALAPVFRFSPNHFKDIYPVLFPLSHIQRGV